MVDTIDYWDSQVQKHLDGQTNAEEAEALSARIVADPGIRARYLQAALVHGALADEVLALDLEDEPKVDAASQEKNKPIRSSVWPQQLAAAMVAGAFMGLLGIGVAWAIGKPRAEVSSLNVAHGTFDSLPPGPIVKGISNRFGEWSGDPVEVVEEADGNRRLRFMETGNVKGDPNGGASACNAFQFIDLAALRHQWQVSDPSARQTLELSSTFERKPSAIDEAFPKLRATLRIYLFDTDPETIAMGWPHVLADVIAVGKKAVHLKPGAPPVKISASCLLEREATVALITVDAGVGIASNIPIALGNYYADDVELTVTTSPKLPVRLVK